MTSPRKTENALCARHLHQRHFPLLAGLEAHGSAGRDVQPVTSGGLAIELQRRVDLVKVVVRSHLDRPVAVVFHYHTSGFAPDVESNVAGLDPVFTWDHHALLTRSGCGR
jgi:hypothetical protein